MSRHPCSGLTKGQRGASESWKSRNSLGTVSLSSMTSGELHGVGLITCEVERYSSRVTKVPFDGVAQVVGCHGVTVMDIKKKDRKRK